MNDLLVLDNDQKDQQEWDKLCSVLRNWEPAEGSKPQRRWTWLYKMVGSDAVVKLAGIPAERRAEIIRTLKQHSRIQLGLLEVIESKTALNETLTEGISEEMLDELGL